MSIKTFLKGKNMQFNSETTKGRLIKIFGESTQETRSGKNKFNAKLIPTGNSKITVNEDGSIITMPVATSGNGYTNTNLKLSQLAPELKVGDSVFLAFTTTSTKNKFIYLSGPAITWFANTAQTMTQEMLDALVCLYTNSYSGGETGTDPVIITDFRMSLGTADLGWEEFGATPSPTIPSEIESAGKLRNYLHHSAKSANVKGIDYTVLEDGTITVKGTATAKSYFNLLPEGAENYVIPAGTYTLSGCPEGGSTSTYVLDINFNSVYYADYGSGVTITLTEDTKIRYCRMIVVAGQTVDLVFKPQLQLGTKIKPFSKDGKFIEYKSIGKNILKGLNTPLTDSSYWYDVNKYYFIPLEDGWGRFSYDNTNGSSTVFINAKVHLNAVELKPNTTYTFITEFRNSSISENANSFFQLATNNANIAFETSKSIGYSAINAGGIYKSVSKTKENLDNLLVSVDSYLRLAAGTKGTVEARISLVEGDYTNKEYTYEPYKESITTIPLLYPMRSLPNGVADTIYYSDGKFYHEQRVGQVILNGSETFWRLTANTNHNSFWFSNSSISNYLTKPHAKMCNRFEYTNKNFLNAPVPSLSENSSELTILTIFNVSSDIANTIDEWKTWLSAHNTELLYQLAEPIVTEISDEIALELLVGYNDLTCDAETWIIYDAERTVFPPIIKITNNDFFNPSYI